MFFLLSHAFRSVRGQNDEMVVLHHCHQMRCALGEDKKESVRVEDLHGTGDGREIFPELRHKTPNLLHTPGSILFTPVCRKSSSGIERSKSSFARRRGEKGAHSLNTDPALISLIPSPSFRQGRSSFNGHRKSGQSRRAPNDNRLYTFPDRSERTSLRA